jgi:fumarate hydratase, class II
MPGEMIAAYAIVKQAAAKANHDQGRLGDKEHRLIAQVCDEILAGGHRNMFPLHVWMSGSGTQFNMNVNEVIANRCAEIEGLPLGDKRPAHPNDHVNMSQSTNDTFPTAMHIAAATGLAARLIPAVSSLRDAIGAKAEAWTPIVKIGRTHLQDATPLTLGQEWSGYAAMLTDDVERIKTALEGLYPLALGGTAVGTGVNAPAGFAEMAIREIARLTSLPFVPAANKFARRAATTRSSTCRARRARSRCRSRKSPTTSGSLPVDRARAWANLRSPKTNRAPRSCRARSIRPRPKR